MFSMQRVNLSKTSREEKEAGKEKGREGETDRQEAGFGERRKLALQVTSGSRDKL